jgi:hypothetical protein
MPTSSPECPTVSGKYRCSIGAAGHPGPCETTEPAPSWIGPALSPGDVRVAVATIRRRHDRELAELDRQLRRVEARAKNLEARAGMTHITALQYTGTSSHKLADGSGMPIAAPRSPVGTLSGPTSGREPSEALSGHARAKRER